MLRTVIDTIDDIDEPLKGLYEERDGKYVLKLEDVDSHPEVRALKTAYTAEKDKRAKVNALLEELKAKVDDPATGAKIRQEYEKQIAELEAKATNYKAHYERAVVDTALISALSESGVTNSALQKAATLLLKPNIKIGEDGIAVVDSDMGNMAIADFVKKWAKTEEGQAFVAQPKGTEAKGSTTASTSGKIENPFKKETFNMTEQSRLYRENRELYERFKREANK